MTDKEKNTYDSSAAENRERRRKTREEHFEDALPEPESGDGEQNHDQDHGQPAPGEDRSGTFRALADAEVDELNSLFRLLHDHGYMTAGQYSVVGDGSGNVTISLTVMPPSSGGLPEDAYGARAGSGDGAGDGDER